MDVPPREEGRGEKRAQSVPGRAARVARVWGGAHKHIPGAPEASGPRPRHLRPPVPVLRDRVGVRARGEAWNAKRLSSYHLRVLKPWRCRAIVILRYPEGPLVPRAKRTGVCGPLDCQWALYFRLAVARDEWSFGVPQDDNGAAHAGTPHVRLKTSRNEPTERAPYAPQSLYGTRCPDFSISPLALTLALSRRTGRGDRRGRLLRWAHSSSVRGTCCLGTRACGSSGGRLSAIRS